MFAAIPVLLVSDDPLVRSGVAALLPEDQPVVRGVGTGVDLSRVVSDVGAEVVVWDTGDDGDVQVADGVPSIALVKDGDAGARALRAGARAVLLRDLAPLRLAAAVIGARHGLLVLDERLRNQVVGVDAGVEAGPAETVEALTSRELEVLQLLAEGRSNREIGVALDISPHTSKFHVDRILAKLTASSRTDAVVRAVRLGLLTL